MKNVFCIETEISPEGGGYTFGINPQKLPLQTDWLLDSKRNEEYHIEFKMVFFFSSYFSVNTFSVSRIAPTFTHDTSKGR